ncbi:unnamed protein product, partial [Porites evermanni]
ESRAIENIPANELDLLFFQRYLHEKGSLINILKDNEFSKSREVLAAKRKNLVRQGKGNCPNATRELTEAEEDALFENGHKTRAGQDGGHQRAFEPKAHESNNKSRCPVEFYKAFRSHRPEAMLEPDAPFYLAINHRRKPSDKVWYLDRPLGKNEISGKFLKDAFAAAKLDDTNKKKVSNHSVRKTSVGRLLEADVQPNFVAQLSGHKNLKSLDSY